jgi:hypothetical protein
LQPTITPITSIITFTMARLPDHATATVVYCYYADGTKEVSGWKGKTAKGEDAFEPTDQWKGDVAPCPFLYGYPLQ